MKKCKKFRIYYFTKLETIREEDEQLYDNKQIDEDFKFINDEEITNPLNNNSYNQFSFFECLTNFFCFGCY